MIGNSEYIGYSDKINDPAIKAALKRNKSAAAIFLVILLIAPIAVTAVIGIKDGDMKIVAGGVFISFVFLAVNVIAFLKRASAKQWDGQVTKKYTERRKKQSSDTGETVYVVEAVTDRGKTKKIDGTINPYYDYLQIGDRIRFHPQFSNFYEKYDKSDDSYVFCPICMTKNNIEDDFCKRCKVPVIK